jgi:hypothetical protein
MRIGKLQCIKFLFHQSVSKCIDGTTYSFALLASISCSISEVSEILFEKLEFNNYSWTSIIQRCEMAKSSFLVINLVFTKLAGSHPQLFFTWALCCIKFRGVIQWMRIEDPKGQHGTKLLAFSW